MPCNHDVLFLNPCAHATVVGFQRANDMERLAASSTSGRMPDVPNDKEAPPSVFPGPLVLPADDLAVDPTMPRQSFRQFFSYHREANNKVTPQRNVMYVAAPPDISNSVSFMKTWAQVNRSTRLSLTMTPIPCFVTEVMDYLRACYTGFTVKPLTVPSLRFDIWSATDNTPATPRDGVSDPGSSQEQNPEYVIGLRVGTSIVGIETRPSPDNVFPAQLSVDDLADAAIASLPEDAYCLLLLVNQDIYDPEAENFVTGLSFSKDRVAVISTARFNPGLDVIHIVERSHSWPASHCREYIFRALSDNLAAHHARIGKRPPKGGFPKYQPPRTLPSDEVLASPMYSALRAYRDAPPPSQTDPPSIVGLWLGRLCLSATREVGRCFGIKHCVYYACVMQCAMGVSEQVRAPPYLCPVDLAKVLYVSGSARPGGIRAHYQALLAFCERYPDVQIFQAFAAWIRSRMAQLRFN